jgi:hypothetical protein
MNKIAILDIIVRNKLPSATCPCFYQLLKYPIGDRDIRAVLDV